MELITGGGGPTSGGGFGALIQPLSPEIIINGGSSSVPSNSVLLELFCLYAGEMQVANGEDPTGATWEPYIRRKPWDLTPGDGEKKVSVRFRAYAGNHSPVAVETVDVDTSGNHTGPTGLAMDNLAWLIANSVNFQNWVGASSAQEARENNIFRYIYPRPLIRPYALITEVPTDDFIADGDGAGFTFIHSGVLYVLWEANAGVNPNDEGWEKACVIFRNWIDAVLKDMRNLACTNGFFCAQEISEAKPITIPDTTEGDEDSEATFIQMLSAVRFTSIG